MLLENVQSPNYYLELAIIKLLTGILLYVAVFDEQRDPVGVRAYLDQLLSQRQQPIDLIVIFQQVGNRNLQKGQLIRKHLQIAATTAVSEKHFVVAEGQRLFCLNRVDKQFLDRDRQVLKLFSQGNELSQVLQAKVFA